MPYIKPERREYVLEVIHDELHGTPDTSSIIWIDHLETAGELQYAMAVMFKSYMERKGLNYQNCNDVMGALAGAQMEFYRRTVSTYEIIKISENGDI